MNDHEQDTIEIRCASAQRVAHDSANAGLCDDLIERFVDVTVSRHGFDRLRCAERRNQLRSLQAWMERRADWGLVNASGAELQRYIDDLPRQAPADSRAMVAANLREFFAYLREIGVRRDDPTSALVTRNFDRRTFEAVA